MKKLLSVLLIIGFLIGGVFLGYAGQPAQYKVNAGDARWHTKLNAGLDALWDYDATTTTLVAALTTLINDWAIEDNIVTMVTATPTYSNGTTFTVPGDYTSRFTAGKVVQARLAASTVETTVVSSTYASPNTTVVLTDSILTNPITRVYVVATRDGLWPNGPGYVVAADYGTDQAALATADGLAAAAGKLLVIGRSFPITSDLTLAANVKVNPVSGGALPIATTKTLTINGSLDAGLYQIFSCAGTGKVAFGLNQKTANPEWFGALGDGATDDYAALASLGASASDGMTLSFRSGANYYSSDGLLMADRKNNITVQGNGAIITFTKAAAPGAWFFKLGNWTDFTTVTGCRVYDLTLTLNRVTSGTTNSGMLAVNHCDDVVIRGCKVLRADVQGIYTGYGNRILIDGNFVGSKTMGSDDLIHGDGIFTSNCSRLTIVNNYVGNTNDDGIFHQVHLGTPRDEDVTVIGNTVVCPDTHYGAGIRVQSGERVIVSDNKVYNTGDVGIDVSNEPSTWLGCHNYSITNNLIVNAGQSPGYRGTNRDGINALGSYRGIISNNNIQNPARHGILASRGMLAAASAFGVVITGNSIDCDSDGGSNSAAGVGIEIVDLNYVTIQSNYIYNPGAYGIASINTLVNDMIEIAVLGNTIINSRKAGEAITNACVEFYRTSTGVISGIVDGNILRDNRTPKAIALGVQADTLEKITIGAGNVTNLGYIIPTTSGTLFGSFTCANHKDTVVSNPAVNAGSIILITPTNAAAATLQGAATCLYISAKVAGTSFTVTTGNAGAAAGTETFNYRIIN